MPYTKPSISSVWASVVHVLATEAADGSRPAQVECGKSREYSPSCYHLSRSSCPANKLDLYDKWFKGSDGLLPAEVAVLDVPFSIRIWALLCSFGLPRERCEAFARSCASKMLGFSGHRDWDPPEYVRDFLRTGEPEMAVKVRWVPGVLCEQRSANWAALAVLSVSTSQSVDYCCRSAEDAVQAQCVSRCMVRNLSSYSQLDSEPEREQLADLLQIMVGSPKFSQTSCSHCGSVFGPGDHGFSHCEDHRGIKKLPDKDIR
jgi:hypothetical protein